MEREKHDHSREDAYQISNGGNKQKDPNFKMFLTTKVN